MTDLPNFPVANRAKRYQSFQFHWALGVAEMKSANGDAWTAWQAERPMERPMPKRFQIVQGDASEKAAAQRMGMTLDAFRIALPNLIARGFPKPDPDTGNSDLDAIDAWRKSRHPHLNAGRAEFGVRDASTVVSDRIEALRRGRP
jgi:hypothetical protein